MKELLSVLNGKRTERIPIFLRDLTLGMDVINVKTTDVFTSSYNSELSAKAVIALQKMTGQDAVVGCIQSVAFNSESFGGKMKYPEYGIPIPLTHPLSGVTELPEVPEIKGKMARAAHSYSIVREKLPDIAVVTNVEGPLTKTGTLTGMDDLALLMISEKDHVNKVIKITTEHTMSFIEKIHKNGAMDCVFLASATDNPDLFGQDIYEEMVLPHVKELVSRTHGLGYPVIFHPHGVFYDDLITKTIGTKIDGFQFSEGNEPGKITKMINKRCAVLGGTDIVPTLLSGTDEEIRERTEYYVRSCSPGNYVFMPSCSLHRGTDMTRVMKMVTAVRNVKD